jgi:hypothetical protein
MHDLPRSAASICSDDVGLIFNTLFLLLIGGVPPKSNLADNLKFRASTTPETIVG